MKPWGALTWCCRGDVASWWHQKKGKKPLSGRVGKGGWLTKSSVNHSVGETGPSPTLSTAGSQLYCLQQGREQRPQIFSGATHGCVAIRHQEHTVQPASQAEGGHCLHPGCPSWPHAAGTHLSGVLGAQPLNSSNAPLLEACLNLMVLISLCSSNWIQQ